MTEWYTASTEDKIVGIVTWATPEFYELDIMADRKAILNSLAFEGATKKSKPNLKVGDLVFCWVEQTPAYLATWLTCIS